MENKNIITANENRFTATNYSEALTAFTVGWVDPDNIAKLLDFIAPPIPVGRRFEFKRSDNAQAFYSENDDVRSIGAEFKRVKYDGESVNEKTLNKGLTIRVDHDEVAGDDWQERYVQMLLQRLLRNELRRAVSALETIATEHASVDWIDADNPDADIRDMLASATNESGIRPNRLLFGESAWDKRMTCLESQNSAVAFKGASMLQSELAGKFLLDGCEVLSSRYQSASTQKSQILGDTVFAFFGQNTVSKDEPSNLKRFYTPTEEGSAFRVYCDEHAKYTDITVEHYSSIVATSKLGVRKLSINV
ncbi:MAG: hypothetical protein E7036_00130 [Opitutales bacterium]|nr:hypothetical protein [Opitutales bacterium]